MVACAINPSDLITISGAYRARTSLPFFPGFEGVGIVTDVGIGCSKLVPGQRVMPIAAAGTWQEFKDHPEKLCLTVPNGLNEEEAAFSYINPMTAWVMLKEAFPIRPGMVVAVSAAGSAIGRMIIRIANEMGIKPVAFCRSTRTAENMAKFEVETVVYDTSAPLLDICLHWPGRKVDAFFDCVGGQDALAFTKTLRPGGAYIHYGLLSGEPVPASIWSSPDIKFSLFHLRDWVRDTPFERVQEVYQQAAFLAKSGAACVRVNRRYRLDDICSALTVAGEPTAEGKILLSLV
jgi:NADPH2:quinone reductase